jgi:hypothetical protein
VRKPEQAVAGESENGERRDKKEARAWDQQCLVFGSPSATTASMTRRVVGQGRHRMNTWVYHCSRKAMAES